MSGRAPSPISPGDLAAGLADRVLRLNVPALILVDGAPATQPEVLAGTVAELVRNAGRQALHVEARYFWRDASVRLEYGREDLDAFLAWLDGAALDRELVRPLREGRPVLPSLRDPATNRATRVDPVYLGEGVVLVSGALLLRHDLDPDLVVHLAASPAALARRTPDDQQWTIAAFARYDHEATPVLRSDVVVRCDDPKHPAVLGLR
jgi:hypothetical protein